MERTTVVSVSNEPPGQQAQQREQDKYNPECDQG